MAERLRWKIVDLVDRLLPGQCWTDLVCWAMAEREDRADRRLPWHPMSRQCREDMVNVGCCYCGAMRQPGPGRLAGHLRTTCCHAPAVQVETKPCKDGWLFPLQCSACGREAGCLSESWAFRSREDATAAGTPNQGGDR